MNFQQDDNWYWFTRKVGLYMRSQRWCGQITPEHIADMRAAARGERLPQSVIARFMHEAAFLHDDRARALALEMGLILVRPGEPGCARDAIIKALCVPGPWAQRMAQEVAAYLVAEK